VSPADLVLLVGNECLGEARWEGQVADRVEAVDNVHSRPIQDHSHTELEEAEVRKLLDAHYQSITGEERVSWQREWEGWN